MPAGDQGWSRAAEVYAAGLFLAYAVVLFVHADGPSLTDYANWTYQGVLLREHLLGQADAAHALKHYPVPNSLTTVGIGLLALVVPWLLAAKTWLVIQLAICFCAMRFLLRTLNAPAVAWVVVPQAVFFNVNFWYGFMNFELGLAWVMVFVSLLLRRAKPWLLLLVLVLVFFTHMIPFAFCLLLLVLQCRQQGRWRECWASLPSVVLTLWYVAGRFLLAGNADGRAGMQETVRNYSGAFWLFKLNSYAKSFGFVNPLGLDAFTFGRTGLSFLLVAEALLACLVACGLIPAGMAALRGEERDRFVWFGLSLLLPVFLLAPGAALGISDPGARVLQTGLGLGVVLCWSDLGPSLRRLAAGCAGLLAAGGLGMFLIYGGSLGPKPNRVPGDGTAEAHFARVPNGDQDFYYDALAKKRMDLPVFPTGMFLNR